MIPSTCNYQCRDCLSQHVCDVPFNQMFVNANECMWLMKNHRFILANEAACDLYGAKNVKEFVGLHPSHLSPESQPCGTDSKSKADQMMDYASARGYHRFEWLAKRLDGDTMRMEISLSPVEVNGGEAMIAVGRRLSDSQLHRRSLDFLIGQTQQLLNMLRFILSESDKSFTGKLKQEWGRLALPMLAKIIEQGNADGCMRVYDPVQTAKLLVQLGLDMRDRLNHYYDNELLDEVMVAKEVTSFVQCIERTLHLEAGAITLSPSFYELIRELIRPIPEEDPLPTFN